jgi:adenine C2-methylase RlmN of 23S rRNA A2503 and tRNA A37
MAYFAIAVTGKARQLPNAGQFMAARDSYGEWPSPKGETPRLLSTIVLMGMGEPLYNYVNVAKAMKIAMDGEGNGLSRRRITLSTSGVVPMMDRAGAELGVNLAVSLHAVTDELRDEIVPLNRKYPLAELLAACRRYPGSSNARRITFEYIMLKGVNDSEAEARELVRLIAGMPAKVNLIPFNPWPGSKYEPSGKVALERFAGIVNARGLPHRSGPREGRISWRLVGSCGRKAGGSGLGNFRRLQPGMTARGTLENPSLGMLMGRSVSAGFPLPPEAAARRNNTTGGTDATELMPTRLMLPGTPSRWQILAER